MFAAPLWLSRVVGSTSGVLARHKQGFFNLFIGTTCIVLSVRSISKEHKIARLERRIAQQKEEAEYLKHLLTTESSEWSRRLAGDAGGVVAYVKQGFELAEARISGDAQTVRSLGFDFERGQTEAEEDLVPSRPAGSALGLWALELSDTSEYPVASGGSGSRRDGDYPAADAASPSREQATEAAPAAPAKSTPEGGIL